MIRLGLLNNNAATNDPCVLCGVRCDPWGGWDVFDLDSRRLVCETCVAAHAPELLAARQAACAASRGKTDPMKRDLGQLVAAIQEGTRWIPDRYAVRDEADAFRFEKIIRTFSRIEKIIRALKESLTTFEAAKYELCMWGNFDPYDCPAAPDVITDDSLPFSI